MICELWSYIDKEPTIRNELTFAHNEAFEISYLYNSNMRTYYIVRNLLNKPPESFQAQAQLNNDNLKKG